MVPRSGYPTWRCPLTIGLGAVARRRSNKEKLAGYDHLVLAFGTLSTTSPATALGNEKSRESQKDCGFVALTPSIVTD
jgi:hypothetical protein